jgi:PAS domain S-box-containing protein
MTGNTQTLKNRLIIFTGSILLLCAFIFVLQYNNYYFSGRFIQYQNTFAKLIAYSGKTDVLHQQFLKNEIYDTKFYDTSKSYCTDSIILILSDYEELLDSLSNDPYLNKEKKLSTKIAGLESDCRILKNDIDNLRNVLLERGFFTTGKAGEWSRFAIYLEELAESYGNSAIIKSVARINRQLISYQYQKRTDQLGTLLNLIFSLKLQITTKNEVFVNGVKPDERLKFITELDNFSAITNEIQKNDIKIGFAESNGHIGELNLAVQVIESKSENLNKELISVIQSKIRRDFILKSVLILIIGLLYFWFSRAFLNDIHKTISEIKHFASELVEGKLPKSLKLQKFKEVSDISSLLNMFIDSLRDKIRFASTLGSGNTEVTLVPLSNEDILSNALLDMEKSLLKADEEDQKYKIEEQKRAWANEGLAKFSEILRMQTDNLSTLSDEIIVELVKYLRASLGSIFIYNDDNDSDIYLELISTFAYDRKKYITKRIEIGEGLIGTCAQEKLPVFLTDIPEDYIEITSGLGDARPRSVLIVPLKTEEKIFGVLEIASFQPFEKHELEFVEKLTQSVASTFATVKINIHTARLLEQSKRQAEEMAQQEEEMRQNFEELQATQEESARREAEISSLIQAVDASSLVLQTDMDGRITEVNKKFAIAVGLQRDELLGRYLKHVFVYDTDTDEFYNLIRDLKSGQMVTRSERIEKENEDSRFFDVHYSSISDPDGHPYKILCIAGNLTHSKHLESIIELKNSEFTSIQNSYNQFVDIVGNGFLQCIIAPDSTIIDVNNNYIEITGYNREELIGSSYRKFLKAEELKQFELIWIELLKEKNYKGVIKRTTPTGEEHWLMASFVPFMDTAGQIEKFYFLAQDITEKKLKYQVLEEANKEIERLKGLQNQ